MPQRKRHGEKQDDGQRLLTIRGVAHDVRQMLGIISGRAGLALRRGQIATQVQADLETIVQAAEDAERMLRRLPGEPPRPAGASEPAAEPAVVIQQVLELVRPCGGWQPADRWAAADQASDSWLAVSRVPADLSVGLPAQVLREVLVNLVLNALEAMPRGGEVAFALEPGADRPVLTVADTGDGFGRRDPQEVFRPGQSSSGEPGRGIGLAACRDLLRRHGGDLTARNGPRGGAVLALELPAVKGQDSSRADAVARPAGTAAPDCPAKGVLIVDDEPGLRQMLSDVLAELGWRPLSAGTAAEGLQLLAGGDCCVALVDFSLPDLTGAELARQLRRQDPALAVVMMTGWANEEVLEDPQGVGADLTARKPLSVAGIEELVSCGASLYLQRRADRAAAED